MRVKYLGEKKTDLHKETPFAMEQIKNVERRQNSPKLNEGVGSNYQYDDQYQKQELGDYEEAFRKLK